MRVLKAGSVDPNTPVVKFTCGTCKSELSAFPNEFENIYGSTQHYKSCVCQLCGARITMEASEFNKLITTYETLSNVPYHCGALMEFTRVVLTSNPAQYVYHCTKCNTRTYTSYLV